MGWESVVALLNAYVDAERLIAALRESGTLPEDTLPLLEKAAALCEGARARIAVAAILPHLTAAPPRRHRSGSYAIDAKRVSQAVASSRASAPGPVPYLVAVRTLDGERGFAVPDYERGRWIKLRNVIETMTVLRLLEANDRPLGLDDLPELHKAGRSPSVVVGRINDQFPGGRKQCFVEPVGAPPRVRGQRRKPNPADEAPDRRLFLIHSPSWHIERAPVTLRCLNDIEEEDEEKSELVQLFGNPARPRR